MPRFVLLRHLCPPGYEKPSHWDFMLEHEGVLRTWELRELPSAWALLLGETSSGSPTAVNATPLPDHRLAYLDYEGPLSGNRGSVSRCDHGTYEPRQETQGRETHEQTHEQLMVLLGGKFLQGTVRLTRQRQGWELSLGEP